MKESITSVLTVIDNNKERNMNSLYMIKEISSDYDRINSNVGLISNIFFQNNIYISKIIDAINDNNTDYDISKDINNIKNLNYRGQETINVLHSILIGTLHAFKTINNSVNTEMDALANSTQYLDNSNIILDSGIKRVNESCKDIYDVISEMDYVINDLDIQYVALDKLNTKFKDINKEIQLVINYSNDVNDNMDKISVFVSQLEVVVNRINKEVIKKIKR
jgi:DNA repair ATPase RecN